MLSALTRLVAPILAFTAEETWQAMPHEAGDNKESVYLNDLPVYDDALTYPELRKHYDKLFELRDDVMKALELARAEKQVGKSLDAKITLYPKDEEQKALLASFESDLPTIFIVSQCAFGEGKAPETAHTEGESGLGVLVEPADGCKCDRCWGYFTVGKHTEDGGFLCPRCQKVLGE